MIRNGSLPLPASANAMGLEASRLERRHRLSELVRISLLVLAAAVALLSVEVTVAGTKIVLGPALSGVLLLATLFVDLVLVEERMLRRWTSEAVAFERIRSEAWRFSIGAERYSLSLSQSEAEDRFSARLAEFFADGEVKSTVTSPSDSQLPAKMLELRAADRPDRTTLYLTRLDEIGTAISEATAKLRVTGTRLRWAERGLKLATLIVATGQALGIVDVNLVGLGAVAIAVTFAWRAIQSPDGLEVEYARIASNLLLARDRIRRCREERDLARLVEETEELLVDHRLRWASAIG